MNLLFRHRYLVNYKKQLTQELLGRTTPQPELEELYIPLKLFKPYPLGQNYQQVCQRKPWPLTEIMAGKKLWLIGKPGSGKTNFLRKLALDLACGIDSGKIPVYIRVKNLTKANQSWLEELAHIFEARGYLNPLKFIKHSLEGGKLVLLLDGLDEIATAEQTQHVLDKINQFLSEYGKYPNTILIACRSTQYCQHLEGVEQAHLAELDELQIEKHILSKLAGSDNPQQLLAKLNGDIRLKRLARTPWGLSGICNLYQNQRDLPINRAELYRACVQQALESLQRPLWPKPFSAQDRLRVLEEIAFVCHTQQRTHFTEAEFCQVVQKTSLSARLTKEEGATLLNEILNTSNLITTCYTMPAYRFSHLALQEFLAAQKIINLPDGIRSILSKHSDGWWTECIVFYAGLLNNSSGMIISLNEVNPKLALKCFAEAKQVYSDLQELMQGIIRQNLVCNLAETLHLSNLPQSLIHQADAETILILSDILRNSPNLGLKVRCAQLLCEIGDEQSLKIIQDELETGNNIETKRCIRLGFDYLWSNSVRENLPATNSVAGVGAHTTG